MTGYDSKRAAARDKLVVADIDGRVVRDARKPKKVATLDRDAEIERLNEKIEFLARTNMLYSDWEHRETQVTSDLIRKGIEEAKINTELRAEIAELKAQLAQPAQEPMQYNCTVIDDTHPNGIPLSQWGQQAPQRPWVGLTDEEIQGCLEGLPTQTIDVYARRIEAKLKEKNT